MDIAFDQDSCAGIADNGQSLLEGLFLLAVQGESGSAEFRLLDAEIYRRLESTYGEFPAPAAA